MAFDGAARAENQHRGLLVYESAGGQVPDNALVDSGVEGEVKCLQGVLGIAAGAVLQLGELLLLAPGHFVRDEQGQKVNVGQLSLDGFAVADLR